MRKILSFIFLVTIMLIILTGCGISKETNEETSKKENIIDKADAAGKYQSLSMVFDNEYILNENMTYTKNGREKGTYKIGSNTFGLDKANDSHYEAFQKNGEYYYRTSLNCKFEEDDEYNLKLTLDENGKTDQWFSANYETISNDYFRVIALDFNSDGTFQLYRYNRDIYGNSDNHQEFEGTYEFEDDILWLTYDEQKYPMIVKDNVIYFDVLIKVE